ncbi:zinc finger, C2H2-type domain containing protein [Pseudohyphozyma bogoriensis]|nr:zinc finger, C2H2-type domain containing protein [Pseudohyphozyma bogoriensis]
MATRVSSSPSSGSPLSTSQGKKKSTTTRRLSSSTLKPTYGLPISHSLPAAPYSSHLGRARSASNASSGLVAPIHDDDGDDGEVRDAAGGKDKGQLHSCEVYRHSTCLVKHRWEHTTHWKEASKLLLSKHQQVQLLEAAAILKAASTGPAAVSPPSSGLLGAGSLNISTLTSPRMYPSQSLRSDSYLEQNDEALDEDEEDDDDEDLSESPSTGDDMLAEGIFDMDLDEQSVTDEGRSRSVGGDSGYGSFGKDTASPGPVLGFFAGGRAAAAMV